MTPTATPAPIRVAVTGANGGYGRTLLAQLRTVPAMDPTVLVDPDRDGVTAMLADLGIDGVTVVAGMDELPWSDVDVLVEATGNVPAGIGYATTAIEHGVHVVMVSKEVETVAGIALRRRADARGVRYLPGDGDQPANLIRLTAWVERVGLEVVALGKSGEYDLQLDPATGTVTQLDETLDAPALRDLLVLGDDVAATLAARADAVSALRRCAAADSCEMTVVAQYTGAAADREDLHYPVVRPSELADVYAARADGGLIGTQRSVDVFSALRLPGEASFAGGVFAVVRTGDPETWRTLAGKGHIVSRDGRYACIAWPYHLMGVETPLTIAEAVSPTWTLPEPARHVVLGGRAAAPIAAGTTFRVHGHHHEIDGVDPVIRPGDEDAAPFYLLGGATLRHDVPAGHLLTLDDVDGVDARSAELFHEGGVAA